MSWRPVLEGEHAARARATIANIADELSRQDVTNPSLGHGAPGIALLFGELAREGEAEAADRASELLARAIERLTADDQPRPWLGNGIAGVAWALQQLQDVVEVDPKTLEEIDAGLLEFLAV